MLCILVLMKRVWNVNIKNEIYNKNVCYVVFVHSPYTNDMKIV